jgi:cellulose synthase/poly-beta-1,6-N-acetylglucosamine synthase-like glycosyltransferase
MLDKKSGNMIKFPLVSVIVPVLNASSHIEDCITSLINQDFPKVQYEIIIIDNGSKDDTLNILERYGEYIKIFSENKKGSYAARNNGIYKSKGEIVAFTDSDCIADKNWLKDLCKAFISEDIGCVVGNVKAYPGKSLIEIFSKNKGILSQKVGLESKFLPYGQTANVAFRKDVFKMIGEFDNSLNSGGDVDISWRMQLETSYKLDYCQNSIVEHHHRTSLKGLFKQQFRYGFGRISLYKRYNDHMKSCEDVNYDIKYNLFHSMRLITNIPLFYVMSIKRLFGLCDKHDMYEPLFSTILMSGYVLGKLYGSVKLKKSFLGTI